MPERDERWAVFWCSLLSPLLYGEIPPEEAGRFLEQLASCEQVFPDGRRRRPSRATLWRKWKKYRDGGFEALFRQRRSDRGQSRKRRQTMIAKAVELKKEQPRRSNVPINQFLQAEFQAAIPKSTLYRHLKRAGATRLKLGVSQQKVRRRWTRDHSNALWLGDFEDGPCVLVGDQAVTTHLSAFIDCHSRYVVEARYYLRENLDIAPEALTDIRLLISSALDDAPPLKVVLAGQDALRQTLRQSLHADLLNRIAVRFHLAPLTKEQTASYIDFQLKQAGGSEKLFDPAAKSLIHDYSGGVPRQINNLATACLLAAAAQNASRISEAILQQTLSEFQLP